MGAGPSKPQAGQTLQVIGAGLPRTGTMSFGLALEKLLHGPCYHCGTQLTGGSETNVRAWIEMLGRSRYEAAGDREAVLKGLRGRLDGYIATTDSPSGQFVEELLELYPEAVVICTTRDPDRWAESIGQAAGVWVQRFLRVVLMPVPTMRWFCPYLDALAAGRWGQLYRKEGEPVDVGYSRIAWDRHMDYLKRTVPRERLHFFDVREGWEPLCKILRVPVPVEPFPRVNDASAMEAHAKRVILIGLLSWIILLGTIGASIWFAWQRWQD